MKKLFLLLSGLLFCIGGFAQTGKRFVITGEMTKDSLYMSRGTIKKLYLACQTDGREVNIDSVTVRNKKFRFTGIAPQETAVYFIKGFDNGAIQLFLEPGNITILPFDGRFPVSAKVKGTPSNNVLYGYQMLNDNFTKLVRSGKSPLQLNTPDSVRRDAKTYLPYQRAEFFGNPLYHKAEIIKYLSDHLDSPAALYIIKYDMFHVFTPKVIERQFLRALSPELHSHSMYKELVNQLKAANLAVGSAIPDFSGKTPDGKDFSSADLKGNYVLIDFWASWCGPCRREFPYLKQTLALTEKFGRFKILSYSIDSKKNDWITSIKNNGLNHKNWIHISTLKGWSSDVTTLFNIKAVPHTVLINPEGKVIAFDLRGEELVNKIKDIAEGKVKYE